MPWSRWPSATRPASSWPHERALQLPEDHPLFAGFLPAMRERIVQLLSGHDVVFAVGAAAFTYHVEGEGPHIPEGTALYQLIEDPAIAAWAPWARPPWAMCAWAWRSCCSARARTAPGARTPARSAGAGRARRRRAHVGGLCHAHAGPGA